MHIPSNSELLALWERGSTEDRIDRALSILFVCTGEPRDILASLGIGARDRVLVEIYEHLFGPMLDAFAQCPSCDEPLQYSLDIRDLVASPPPSAEPLQLTTDGASLRLRLPDSFVLAGISGCTDLAVATRRLTEHCVLEAIVEGKPMSPHELPEDLMEPISAALAAADPAMEILIDLRCMSCSHGWQIVFDIEHFLWTRISSTARRLLREVHALATAYGWSEPEVLSLGPARRQAYLEMACPA